MAGMTVLFVVAVPCLSGISLFLAAQIIAIVLGGITLVSLFWRYRWIGHLLGRLHLFSVYPDGRAVFPGVVQALANYLTK